jgi:hypothetical protein
MSRIKEENLAGKNRSTHFSAGYDCELPSSVRSELLKSRRGSSRQSPPQPRITRPIPAKTSRLRRPLLLMAGLLIVVLALASYNLWYRGQSAQRSGTSPVVGQSFMTAAPTVSTRRLPPSPPGPQVVVPRAVRVHRIPRAQLVDPPPAGVLVVGSHYLLVLPYQIECRVTYRGESPSVEELPSRGNQIGDMRTIGATPWIWIWAPGASRATWIDP